MLRRSFLATAAAGTALATLPVAPALAAFGGVRLRGPAATDAEFGTRVAIGGARVAVSAPGVNFVDVFALRTGYPRVARLGLQPPPRRALAPFLAELGLPPDFPILSSGFGVPLAFAGEFLVTGTGNRVEPRPNEVFGLPDTLQIFRRSGNGYVLRNQLVQFPPLALGLQLLGNRLALVQGTVVQIRDLDGTVRAAGAPTDLPEGSRFGEALAADGTTIVVGAPGFSDGASVAGGAAYVFDVGADKLTQIARLSDPNSPSNDFLGQSVAVSGDLILVGSSGKGGRGLLFRRTGNTVRLVQGLPAGTGPNTFGTGVALSGTTAVVATQPFTVTPQGQARKAPTAFVGFRPDQAGGRFMEALRFQDPAAGTDVNASLSLSGAHFVAGGGQAEGGRGAASAFVLF